MHYIPKMGKIIWLLSEQFKRICRDRLRFKITFDSQHSEGKWLESLNRYRKYWRIFLVPFNLYSYVHIKYIQNSSPVLITEKVNLSPTMPWRHTWRATVQRYPFLTLTLHGRYWSVSSTARFILGKEHPDSLSRRLGGTQSWFGWFWRKGIRLLL